MPPVPPSPARIALVVLLALAWMPKSAHAIPMRLALTYEAITWRFEPFGLAAPPGPVHAELLFDTDDDQDHTPDGHFYLEHDVVANFFFGIEALDTRANFDVLYGSPGGPGPLLFFDESDLVGTLRVDDFVAFGSAREDDPSGASGSGTCPVHEFVLAGPTIAGRNGGIIRPSDGRFDCRFFDYTISAATLTPRDVPEPSGAALAGLALGLGVTGARRRARVKSQRA